jgi:hypothetical protein
MIAPMTNINGFDDEDAACLGGMRRADRSNFFGEPARATAKAKLLAHLNSAAKYSSPADLATAMKKSRRRHLPRPAADEDAERCLIGQAAAILGIQTRKLQVMSQRGEIPGAAKIKRQWTYDLAKLHRFVEQKEQATTCQSNARPRRDATGAGKFSGAKPSSVGNASGGRLKQMIQSSQRRVAKLEKSER